jgi:hypothetical protein
VSVPWLVVDPAGVPVVPIRRFLIDFVARDNRGGSVRSYAYDLLRWWRWLRAVDVAWDKATPAEARDLVLWLKQARKDRSAPPSLRLDPSARPRLLTIITNLKDRVQEARLNGWLGEVDGLQTSLRAASAKLVTLDRMRDRPPAGAVSLGMPIITTD